jgi:hypothetical protein
VQAAARKRSALIFTAAVGGGFFCLEMRKTTRPPSRNRHILTATSIVPTCTPSVPPEEHRESIFRC